MITAYQFVKLTDVRYYCNASAISLQLARVSSLVFSSFNVSDMLNSTPACRCCTMRVAQMFMNTSWLVTFTNQVFNQFSF